jgi:multidrug efflux system membrane fusion protein
MQLLSLSSSQRVAARSILAILGAAMLVSACSRPAPPEEPVRSVKVITVGLGAFESGQEYAGEVRARVESRLGFRVAGKITKRTVEVGQRVKAGQLLAQLDPRDYQLAADAGRAQVVAATTQRDLAAADLTRYRTLKDQNFISGAELERREATLKAAQATLEQAQAQLAGQGNQTGYTQLLADVSGVVTAVEAEAGQVVAAGTPVVRIAQDGPRDVVFAVPEDKLARVPVGSAVTVRSWTGGPSLRGTVRELAASADPVTRTFPVKVTLSEKDAGEALPLGATAYVVPQAVAQLAGGVIKLPTSALRQEGKGSAVWGARYRQHDGAFAAGADRHRRRQRSGDRIGPAARAESGVGGRPCALARAKSHDLQAKRARSHRRTVVERYEIGSFCAGGTRCPDAGIGAGSLVQCPGHPVRRS